MPVLEEAPVLRAEEFEQFMASVGQQSTGRQSEANEVVKEAAQVGAEGALAGKILCECSPLTCDEGELVSPNHTSEQTNLSAGTEWAEEFADLTSADAALHPDTAEGREAYKRDFWKSLEDDWKEAADADHPWLNEFSSSYEPFKDYEFREENPLAETSNPLEEGKQRLEAVSFTFVCLDRNHDYDLQMWYSLMSVRATYPVRFSCSRQLRDKILTALRFGSFLVSL